MCLNFLTLILSALLKSRNSVPVHYLTMMHFVRTFLIMRARRKAYIAIEEVRNYTKIIH